MSLNESTILVIGGTGGIGRGILNELQSLGARIHFTYRNEEKAQSLKESLGAESIHYLDFEKEPLDSLQTIISKIGIPDYVFIAAGSAYYGSFELMDSKDIDHVIEVDLKVPILITNFFIPKMKEKGEGHIHIVSAIAGLVPALKNMSVYTACKFGLIGFVRALGMELISTKVKVSVSAPAGVVTDLVTNASGDTTNFEKVIEGLRKNFDSIETVGKGILEKLDQREPVILPTENSIKFFESSKDRKYTN
jgi:NAD(P)-dependent dehydrogenase (short-subunit alcohol dehydrogenase family)